MLTHANDGDAAALSNLTYWGRSLIDEALCLAERNRWWELKQTLHGVGADFQRLLDTAIAPARSL